MAGFGEVRTGFNQPFLELSLGKPALVFLLARLFICILCVTPSRIVGASVACESSASASGHVAPIGWRSWIPDYCPALALSVFVSGASVSAGADSVRALQIQRSPPTSGELCYGTVG